MPASICAAIATLLFALAKNPEQGWWTWRIMRRNVTCLKSRSSFKIPMRGAISTSRLLVALLRVLRRFSRAQLDPVIRNGSGKISRISEDTSLWRTLRSRLHFVTGQVVLPWNVSSARQCQSYPKVNSSLTPFSSSNLIVALRGSQKLPITSSSL